MHWPIPEDCSGFAIGFGGHWVILSVYIADSHQQTGVSLIQQIPLGHLYDKETIMGLITVSRGTPESTLLDGTSHLQPQRSSFVG